MKCFHSKNVVLVKVTWQGINDKNMTWELETSYA